MNLFKTTIETNDDEIILIYENKPNDKKLKLFGDIFVNNNKNICKIIYKNKIYDLETEFNAENVKENKKHFKIKLIGVNNIINMSYMFENSLIKIYTSHKLNTSNVIDMSYMFYNCKLLNSLPDISKWNIRNIKNIRKMFYNCKSLKTIPDISIWNINNVKDINGLFENCSSLSSIPDISKWNTSNVTNISYMFYGCSSLSLLPDISKWNTSNVTDISYMFYYCSSLCLLTDISKWNTLKITKYKKIFHNCISLSYIPNMKINDKNIASKETLYCLNCINTKNNTFLKESLFMFEDSFDEFYSNFNLFSDEHPLPIIYDFFFDK